MSPRCSNAGENPITNPFALACCAVSSGTSDWCKVMCLARRETERERETGNKNFYFALFPLAFCSCLLKFQAAGRRTD